MDEDVYHAVPRVKSYAPGRKFPLLSRALLWAGLRAKEYKVGYSVWLVAGGRPRLVATVPAGTAEG